ncbi:hypothetical protein LUZ60_011690 [Juncus effusus]|nr:hypothetical protein LUZ60_011690 [Juncus effusus]
MSGFIISTYFIPPLINIKLPLKIHNGCPFLSLSLSLSLIKNNLANMGFPVLCNQIILPKPLFLIFQLLGLIRYSISFSLFYLGLIPVIDDYAFSLYTPTIEPPYVSLYSPIKCQLCAVKFLKFHQEEGIVCAVCLGQLKAREEVRELGNCSHLFHKDCIDKWIDLGKISCPLCRASLLPKLK